MKPRSIPAFVVVLAFLYAARAFGQVATNTPTPQRTPTPTPTSIRIADLSITKTAAPNPVGVGQNLTYTLTVHNAGPNFANPVSVHDTLPGGVTLVSVTNPPNWTCSGSNSGVSCSAPLFFGGNTAQIVIVVKPTAEGSLTNTAVVSCSFVNGGCIDPDQSNNTATVTTQAGGGFTPVPAFLHGSPANPPVLYLDGAAPTATAAKYKDSGVVRAGLQSPWVEVGAWPAQPSFVSGSFIGLDDLHGWVGLKNSDDQGTQFDLRAEVWKNLELVGAGETSCIKGLVRDPGLAKETAVPFDLFSPVDFNGTTDVLILKVLTRIGAHCSGPNHVSATGLRFYFDGITRPSRFALSPGLRLQ